MTSLRLALCLLVTATTLLAPLVHAAGGVRLMVKRVGGGEAMVVRNDLDVPVNAVLRIQRPVNVAGVGKGAIQRTVPPHSQVRIALLRKRKAGFPMMYRHSFSYRLHYSPEPGALAVGGPAYELPWRGGPFRISQGAGGDFSHNSPRGRYAVDIAMPRGTPIVAARDGTVIEVHDNQAGRWPRASGNFVRIRHEDGTESAYLHLKRGSVVVKPGQQVGTGTLLARSGNTGRSTGPHLHFVVQKAHGEDRVSIPFRFSRPVESLPNFALKE